MSLDTLFIALILLAELARWIYDYRWLNAEMKELLEQSKMLEDIAVTLSLREDDKK